VHSARVGRYRVQARRASLFPTGSHFPAEIGLFAGLDVSA